MVSVVGLTLSYEAVGLTPLEEIERRMIRETLRHTDGDKRMASQLLGIATRTIYRKLEQEQAGGDKVAGGSPGGEPQ